MKTVRVLVLSVLLLNFAACNRRVVTECSAKTAQEPVIAIVKEQLEKEISQNVKGDDGNLRVGISKIRAAIAQLQIAIGDIRTSKEDPNSTKRFCTGALAITMPAEAVADAESARQGANLNTVDQLADQSDVQRNANRFSSELEFNIQPTDDGTKIFAQAESGKNMFDFTSEIMSSALLKSAIENENRQRQQAEQQQAAAENSALAEQRAANLNQARTEDQISIQSINAVWQALDPEVRTRALPLQRAWVRKKIADCNLEAASASIDPHELKVKKLQCDTRQNNERMNWLTNIRNNNSQYGE